MQKVETRWQTKEGLLQLIKELVHIQSITGSKEEISLALYIQQQLQLLTYFQNNPEHVKLHPTGDGRFSVAALVKKEGATNTVVLVSHFDVVNVDDYGKWKDLAFRPDELTAQFYENAHVLPEDARADIESGEWLFGRGVMDMKCGVASQLALVERAANGLLDGNILLLAVCDEEVNSKGMISTVPLLLEWEEKYNLHYVACLNCEPMFARYPGDSTKYIYTGSLGKILPGFFCYGKEAHAGEPLAGLNANMMTSYITCELELNTDFCEEVEGEITPPPTSLLQRDLKKEYSVQTPHKGVSLYNVFLMEKSIMQITDELRAAAERAARAIEGAYRKQAQQFATLQCSVPQEMSVRVISFAELLSYANQMYGRERIAALTAQGQDERELAISYVDEMVTLCSELAPCIVLFYVPPFYPAVSSRHHEGIRTVTKCVLTQAWEQYGIAIQEQKYFGGLSDLSYTGLSQPLDKLSENMPLWGTIYELPLQELQSLHLPVLNIGPVGKDAHKWTERLDVAYATGPLQELLRDAVEQLLNP
jgi:arginine utilization protein RocB